MPREPRIGGYRFAGQREALGPVTPAPALGPRVTTQAVVAVIGKVIETATSSRRLRGAAS